MSEQDLRGFCWAKNKDKNVPRLDELFWLLWSDFDRYIDIVGDDLPYWSTEMNLVAHLAVAASKLGPVAIEYTERKPKWKKMRRPDAWLRLSWQKDAKSDVLVEAKRDDFDLVKTDAEKISAWVKDYFIECKKYLSIFNDPSWKSTIFFGLVSLEASKKDEYETSRDKFIGECGKALKKPPAKGSINYWAHYFLPSEKLEQGLYNKDNCYYPGIVVFGQLWPRQAGAKKSASEFAHSETVCR